MKKGRPKLETDQQREKSARIRLLTEEHDLFHKIAKSKGLGFSAWARMTMLAACPKEK